MGFKLFDDYTGLYIFSALFQGDIAFLALSGVFVVYRLQLVSNAISAAESEIIEFVSDAFVSGINQVPEQLIPAFRELRHLMDHLKKFHDDLAGKKAYWANIPLSLMNNNKLSLLINARNNLHDFRSELVNSARTPMLWMIVTVLIVLVGLPLAPLIHSSGFLIEVVIIGIVVCINAIAIIINAQFSLRLLKDQGPEEASQMSLTEQK